MKNTRKKMLRYNLNKTFPEGKDHCPQINGCHIKRNEALSKDPKPGEWELQGETVFRVRNHSLIVGPRFRDRSPQAPGSACHRRRLRPHRHLKDKQKGPSPSEEKEPHALRGPLHCSVLKDWCPVHVSGPSNSLVTSKGAERVALLGPRS